MFIPQQLPSYFPSVSTIFETVSTYSQSFSKTILDGGKALLANARPLLGRLSFLSPTRWNWNIVGPALAIAVAIAAIFAAIYFYVQSEKASASAEEANTAHQQATNALQEQIVTLRTERDNLATGNAALRDLNVRLLNRIRETNGANDELKEIAERNYQLSIAAKRAADRASSELGSTKIELGKLRTELETARGELRQKENKIAQLQERLKASSTSKK